MDIQKIGPIEVIKGQRNSKVPFSTSILVKGNEADGLIDCGTGEEGFSYLNDYYDIQHLLLTHYHIDHVWGSMYYPNAKVFVNRIDAPKLNNPEWLAKAMGIRALMGESELDKWLNASNQGHSYQDVLAREKEIYPYDETFTLAGRKIQMLHAPGHCEGFCCPYFPEEGVLVVGDYDLTSFGPWYNNADSDIDQLITSGEMTLNIDADYYVTSHHKGIFSRKEYEIALDNYLAIVEKRERKIIQLFKEGTAIGDLIHREVFYLNRNIAADPNFLRFEIMGIAKHLKRLAKQNPYYEDHYQSFISYHMADPKYSEFFIEATTI
ncbi:glyoxylase-like metal-dependent hydrolase (beta-lactamase superfamily II) [Geomicrobium halophilum]|uniref:Glyoxylase-like metal-dependent hydrolase (Beta-lactamase superfamily II) n=1 Tax=Geomicrobium halophilum TaxID=549000 RepID=A0A841PK20_9BACL|nr:MBL fold metallo-hydrolase [Geomicrobium halophilum]MBB6449130.1 glyoxylase-like metal-dependent hydrolase (beta-lactamase superfamily II) [Geomicrobium halophilum]